MGTINYKTSDYITIGYNCNYFYSGTEEENENERYFCDDDFYQIEHLLKQERFYYFHVTIEPGYYEGFYINIENNFPWCYDNHHEKQEAQKEITRIKAFLLECINNFGCCSVYPGWCTGYADYKQTIKDLNGAIKEMRGAVHTVPTWARLPKSEKCFC